MTVEQLIDYCREKQRVCPVPTKWIQLWDMLPERQKVGSGWEPPAPLILAAWHYSSNLDKQLRLADHIRWASTHGHLESAIAFLTELSEKEWHHLGE